LLAAGLGQHLEEQEVRQLGDVLVIGDAVVSEDMTESPELGDDVGSGAGHQAVFFHSSSLISPRIASSSPPNTLLSRVTPPLLLKGSASSDSRSTINSFATCSPMRVSHLRCGSVQARLPRMRRIAALTLSS